LFLSIFAIVTASLVAPASAATSTNISGHWKESYPKSGPPDCFTSSPCGLGELSPYGSAAEAFSFGGSDGFDANGCEHLHGTTTITLADSARSSFETNEVDTICHPGNSHNSPGHVRSYGNPYTFTGTWSLVPESGTGIFSSACGGSGAADGNFAGSTGIIHYVGALSFC
jgi:hypothetical protein